MKQIEESLDSDLRGRSNHQPYFIKNYKETIEEQINKINHRLEEIGASERFYIDGEGATLDIKGID